MAISRPHIRWILLIAFLLIASVLFLLPERVTSPYYSNLNLPDYLYPPSRQSTKENDKDQIIKEHGLPGRSSSKDYIDLSAPKPKAKFVILSREIELNEILWSLKSLEESFNNKTHAHYDYIFLNNGNFTQHYKEMVRKSISSQVEFGEIPEEDWKIPDHIDMVKAKQKWEALKKAKVPYADSASYRQMCRFQSGKFYDQKLLDGLEYYWRVEPGVRFYCDLENFDPFRYMKQYKKKYGWTLALREYPATLRSLWPWTKQFYEANSELYLPKEESALKFVLAENGVGYNRCHFWSNFEIADLSLWRSEGYRKFFEFLDLKGGFFYSRWGDAPIHSIGAALLLRPSEMVQFDNIGYYHPPFTHCPRETTSKCNCDPRHSFDYDSSGFSCQREYDGLFGLNSSEIVAEYKASHRQDEINAPPTSDWLIP